MKKRLFGLVAMMLATMVFVLAFPVQVKAEIYNVANLEYGFQFSENDQLYLTIGNNSGNTITYYMDNNKLVEKSGGFLALSYTPAYPYYPQEGNLYFGGLVKDSNGKYHAYLVTTLQSNSSTVATVPKLSPEQQAILKYNDAWDKVQKEYADETQMPVEPFMSAKAIASVPETVKNNSTAIANLKSLKTVPGVMALINKAQKVTAGDKVAIYTEKPMTFSKEGFEAISNQNKTVVYAFKLDGVLYQITIPAGAKVDFGENEYAGPLWIGAQLGTTAILE